MFVRKLRSRAGRIQIQVVEKVKRNNRVVKHLGTARNSLEEQQLIMLARQYIDEARIKSGVISFFDTRYTPSDLNQLLSRLRFHRALSSPTYHFFSYFYQKLGFNILDSICFQDLVIARIIHPVSKAKTREWLETNLNHHYSLAAVYRCMATAYVNQYQDNLEQQTIAFAKAHLSPVITVLFFDVTTLYYEAFDEDDFRKFGFSKDRRDNQPQIVVTLTVTSLGFPLHLKAFEGNKFEGHTMIPCIQEIRDTHHLDNFVVVADSAMVSKENMVSLELNHIQYIVGARLGNLSQTLFNQITTEVVRVDGSMKRFDFGEGRHLVVSYSGKRAIKDKSDREKQIKRAQYVLTHQSIITNRYKFLEKTGKNTWRLKYQNIEKAQKLEGLKGYITNASDLTDEEIVAKYAQLWQVEKSFRISKSDLKARPIFHTLKEKIEVHLSIVFAALAITCLVELRTKLSLQRIIELLDQIKEIVVEDLVSGESISKYTEGSQESRELLKLANITWVT